ncbi:unnamed protein product [Urochloa humidicola]
MGNCCFKLNRAAVWADGDEWEEEWAEAKAAKAAAAAAEAKMDHRRVEVKIRVTKRQLQELLEKAGGKAKARQQAEKVLAELMTSGKVCYQKQHEEMRGHWRPALCSIPESIAEESS